MSPRLPFALIVLLSIAFGASAADAPVSGPKLKTPDGDLAIFPPDNPLNQDISNLPVHPRSAKWVESIGAGKPLHPDFGMVWKGVQAGIPYALVPAGQAKVPVHFEYSGESDPGPYPIPPDVAIEGGANAPTDSDRHILVIDYQGKKLYEMWHCFPDGAGGWKAGAGAIFDLTSNKLRKPTWTSADAAGLPIFPLLVRPDEIAAGEIKHALRFTVVKSSRGYMLPARHWASRSNDPDRPPMGARFRLRADFDITKYPKQAQVVLRCLKKYGMILADNGSDWFVSGVADPNFVEPAFEWLKRVKGKDFEAVDTGPVYTDQNPEK